MLVTIDIQDSAFDKVMYLLNHLQDDVKILQKDDFLEVVNINDDDYNYFLKARENRKNGEVLHSLDDVMKEFE